MATMSTRGSLNPRSTRTITITSRLALVLLMAPAFQYCGSSKSASTSTASAAPVETFENPVSYARQIQPIMVQKCTPCHFPEQGRKKMLDTYEATRDNVQDILHRVQLPADHIEYMPFKGKKEALTAGEIDLLKQWVAQRMPQ